MPGLPNVNKTNASAGLQNMSFDRDFPQKSADMSATWTAATTALLAAAAPNPKNATGVVIYNTNTAATTAKRLYLYSGNAWGYINFDG
jgi:hypothetical protein